MNQMLRQFLTFTKIFVWLFLIDQILATNYYEINEKYPLSVHPIHKASFKSGNKRSANDDIDTQFTRLSNEQEFSRSKVFQRKSRHSKKGHACARCPQLITSVANEGLDGILMIPPKARSCKTNLPFARNLFQIETLFGPEMSFVLPQGRHRIQAKIRNVETGLIVHTCVLKYNVIVRHCPDYPSIKHQNLAMSCTAGTLWGSKCAFRCKNNDEYLSHRDPINCNENLECIGNIPECSLGIENDVIYPSEYVQDEPKNARHLEHFCNHPEPPTNGRYKCDMHFNDFVDHLDFNFETFQTLASGTKCRVQCNRTYSIPFHLYPMSVIECSNGTWNSTIIEFCYKKMPQHHLHHDHHHRRISQPHKHQVH